MTAALADQLDRIGKATERRVAGYYRELDAGRLTVAQFRALAVDTIRTASARGKLMAQLQLWAWLQRTTGRAGEPPLAGLTAHELDAGRLDKSIGTILSTRETTRIVAGEPVTTNTAEMRLGRLAYSEPVETGQHALNYAMHDSGRVKGWTRGLEPDACQLCQWWSRDGQIWPTGHDMPTHKGCLCIQQPVGR